MLTTLSVFGSLTIPEERGRVGGLIGFFVFLLFFIVNYSIGSTLDFTDSVWLCLSINLLPFVGLLFKNFRVKLISIRKQSVNYYEKEAFVFYSFIPWISFFDN